MDQPSTPTLLVIFGAAGDLTWRKLAPALYNLFLQEWLPSQLAIVGVDRRDMDDDAFRLRLRDGVTRFSNHDSLDEDKWADFAASLHFLNANIESVSAFGELDERMRALGAAWEKEPHHVFYLAIPPSLVARVVQNLSEAALLTDHQRSRIVVEKPFGHDLASAQALNHTLLNSCQESQIYRIDHYLGKETVQNILAFRFANTLFEPLWNQRYIDHVQITAAEQVGVGHRGAYYEGAGALRDMIQNHLLQLLCLVAMEPPVSFTADEIRNKKVDVLRAIRPLSSERIVDVAVRGQYAAGQIEGQEVPAYRDEPDVSAASTTETFAALKLFVDNWRWQNVPFYLRTGKRLPAKESKVTIQFRPVPHRSFPSSAVHDWQPNRIVIHIQPDEGTDFGFLAKQPGPFLRLDPVRMAFRYQSAFKDKGLPEAYETLLLDVLHGDATLFMREDQVEEAWRVVMPALEAWKKTAEDLALYPAGSWGPDRAGELLAQDGRRWL